MATTYSILREIRKELEDYDLLYKVVNSIYSSTGDFSEIVFFENDVFLDTMTSDLSIKELLTKFYEGYDLDLNKLHANPNAEYFRYDEDGNIESTDEPGEIYENYILEISDWLKDNIQDIALDTKGLPKYFTSLLDSLRDI